MTYSVNVSVEGIRGNYCLTDSDLRVVFGRFGEVLQVLPIGDGRCATISYAVHGDAQRAINELDGKVLSGVNSAKLRVCWNMPAGGASFGSFPASAAAPMGSTPASSMGAAPMGGASREFSPGLRKYTCRFEIPIENDKEFQIARRVIGKSGANMKRIVATTDAKLRLRGRGSGYLEGYNRTESPEPLHLCVSAPTKEGYEEAVRKVSELLESIFREYQEYCVSKQWPVPDLKVVIKENPLSGQPILHGSSGFNIAANSSLAALANPVKSPLLQPRAHPFSFSSTNTPNANTPNATAPYWGV